jgi:hypothetical protein
LSNRTASSFFFCFIYSGDCYKAANFGETSILDPGKRSF